MCPTRPGLKPLLLQPTSQVVSMSNITFPHRLTFYDIYPNPHNSPSRTRTYNLAVNSRSLYQLSYRGIPMNRGKLAHCALKAILI